MRAGGMGQQLRAHSALAEDRVRLPAPMTVWLTTI